MIDKASTSSSQDDQDVTDMRCPKCNVQMVLREARFGRYAGRKFWGCSAYPRCKAIVNIDETDEPVATQPQPIDMGSPLQFYASPLNGMHDMQAYQSIAVRSGSLS